VCSASSDDLQTNLSNDGVMPEQEFHARRSASSCQGVKRTVKASISARMSTTRLAMSSRAPTRESGDQFLQSL
jgi:hypothetical protein